VSNLARFIASHELAVEFIPVDGLEAANIFMRLKSIAYVREDIVKPALPGKHYQCCFDITPSQIPQELSYSVSERRQRVAPAAPSR
jgi:hypothetical protein